MKRLFIAGDVQHATVEEIPMKRLFITGDVHRTVDIQKIIDFQDKMGGSLTKNDVLVVLGDWGAIWHGDERDAQILDWWDSCPWTTFVVPGNHDNHVAISKLPVREVFSSPAYVARETVFVAISGNIYDILGKKCLTVGGADSVDKAWRTKDEDWWEEETITEEIATVATNSLSTVYGQVDYYFTHTGGFRVVSTLGFKPTISDYWVSDISEKIYNKKCQHFCGHYHVDKIVDSNHRIVYNDIIMLTCMEE